MNSSETIKQFGSAPRQRLVDLHGLAAAGAMLTCIAVALNVGPFAKPPKIHLTVENARSEAAGLTPEIGPGEFISVRNPEVRMPEDGLHGTMDAANPPAPVAPPAEGSSGSSSLPVFETASSTSQLISPTNRSGDMEERSPSDESGPIDLASFRHPDDANADLAKSATIVGVWAPNAGTCSARDFREGALPAVISTDGAWAGETFCTFSNKKQTETGWSVVAKCSSPKARWTANVRLTVKDNRLTWTSRRGTQAYTRCSPDVLMAAAR